MRKPQVLKFWAELQLAPDTASVVRKYKDQDGYASERTLYRYAQAAKGFSENLSIEDLSGKIGWSPARLKILRKWWESKTRPRPVEDDSAGIQRAHLLEISGHGKELRELAVSLKEELRAPLEHFLGLFNLPAKPRVNLELGDGLEAFGDLPLLAALKSHTPCNAVWGLLEQWTRKLGDLKSQWPPLCRWVENQPQVHPQLQMLEPTDSVRGTPGLTGNFAKTVVLASLTDAYLGRSKEYLEGLSATDYDIEGPNTLYVLSWNSYESHVVAVDHNVESLESPKRLHLDLRSELRKKSLLRELLSGCREYLQLKDSIADELSSLAHLPVTGACGRCQSWPGSTGLQRSQTPPR